MRDFHVLGQAGADKPLPDMVENADELNRFVELFVRKGWNVWPLPSGITERMMAAPLQLGRSWYINERASKWRWHMVILGEIAQAFPAYVAGIATAKRGKHQPTTDLLVVRKPIAIDRLMEWMEQRGYIKKAGRA